MLSGSDEILNLLPHLFNDVLHLEDIVGYLYIVGFGACGIDFPVDLLDQEIHALADGTFGIKDLDADLALSDGTLTLYGVMGKKTE